MKLGPQTQVYIRASLDGVIPLMTSKLRPTQEMNDLFLKKLMGESAPSPKPVPLNRQDQHVMKLFWIFSEIHGCIERLKDSETYIRRFPFSGTRVSRAAYLQFVVEGHLNEIYLLRERLEKLAKTVARLFRHDKNAKRIKQVTDALVEFVAKSLSGLTRTRGSHVHDWRYSNEDIDRLQMIATLRTPKGSPFSKSLLPMQRLAIKESHDRLRRQSLAWNQRASKVMEEFFKVLCPIIFSADHKSYVFPSGE